MRSDLSSCAVVCFFKERVLNDVAFTLFIILHCLDAIFQTLRSAKKVTPIVIVVAIVKVEVGDLLAVQSGKVGFVACIEAFKSKVMKKIRRYLLLHFS